MMRTSRKDLSVLLAEPAGQPIPDRLLESVEAVRERPYPRRIVMLQKPERGGLPVVEPSRSELG